MTDFEPRSTPYLVQRKGLACNLVVCVFCLVTVGACMQKYLLNVGLLSCDSRVVLSDDGMMDVVWGGGVIWFGHW